MLPILAIMELVPKAVVLSTVGQTSTVYPYTMEKAIVTANFAIISNAMAT